MPLRHFRNKIKRRLLARARTLIQLARIALYRLLSDASVEGKPNLLQPLQCVGFGTIVFSHEVRIGVFLSASFFSSYAYLEARNPSSKISIGDNTWINNGFVAVLEHTSITIGRRVLIGTDVEIFDSDFHGMRIEERGSSRPDWAKPVIIEDDVFIGSNVRILKGVTTGRGSVIANSPLVICDIPRGLVTSGNPARVIRMIESIE
jgi:maltose O-acetyltransferase